MCSWGFTGKERSTVAQLGKEEGFGRIGSVESSGHRMISQLESSPSKQWVCPEECKVERALL